MIITVQNIQYMFDKRAKVKSKVSNVYFLFINFFDNLFIIVVLRNSSMKNSMLDTTYTSQRMFLTQSLIHFYVLLLRLEE